jgi:flagellar basal body-associated protein FliL
MALGISSKKLLCMLLLLLVIVISLVLSNIPFLVSSNKTTMVRMEGMTPGNDPKKLASDIKSVYNDLAPIMANIQ